jgi:serine/threonine-protein kinase RsbW
MALRPQALRRRAIRLVRSPWLLWRWTEFTIPSTLNLAPFLEVLLEPVRCATLQAQLQLGLQEALVNAVRHGNGNDPSKWVRIRRIETPRWWIWQVQDEGQGLPHSARRGALPDHCDATGGRGLYLIHQCFDDVRWSRRGNRLQLAVIRSRNQADLFSADGLDNPDRSALL